MAKKRIISKAKVRQKIAAKATRSIRSRTHGRINKEKSAAMIRANFGDVLKALSKE
jgi:hypothetical protein